MMLFAKNLMKVLLNKPLNWQMRLILVKNSDKEIQLY